jgi:hypothetical protein
MQAWNAEQDGSASIEAVAVPPIDGMTVAEFRRCLQPIRCAWASHTPYHPMWNTACLPNGMLSSYFAAAQYLGAHRRRRKKTAADDKTSDLPYIVMDEDEYKQRLAKQITNECLNENHDFGRPWRQRVHARSHAPTHSSLNLSTISSGYANTSPCLSFAGGGLMMSA